MQQAGTRLRVPVFCIQLTDIEAVGPELKAGKGMKVRDSYQTVNLRITFTVTMRYRISYYAG